jgi:hypothetical protein
MHRVGLEPTVDLSVPVFVVTIAYVPMNGKESDHHYLTGVSTSFTTDADTTSPQWDSNPRSVMLAYKVSAMVH